MRELGGNDETSDGGRGQGRENTRDKGRKGKSGDVTTTGRGQLAENTNLDTQGANVAESAESIGGNELGARRHVGVVWVGGHGVEGIVLVLGQQLSLSRHKFNGASGRRRERWREMDWQREREEKKKR